MLKLTMRNWTSQINSMGVGALVCLIVIGWYTKLHWMSWRSIHCPWYKDELGVSSIRWKQVWPLWLYCHGYIIVGMSKLAYVGARSLAVRSHMFVQSEQGRYEYCWIWYRLIKVWMAKWWRVWCRWQQCANFCVWWLWVVCPCLKKEL